jgi:hypothetical protein
VNCWISWVSLGVAVIALALAVTHEIRNREIRRQATRIALTRTTQTINDLVHLLVQQVKAASDGFTPSNFDELFSNRAAEIISFHLNISKEAPIVPRRTWRVYLTESAQKFQREVRQILNERSEYLPNRIIEPLAELGNSFFVEIYARMEVIRQVDQQEDFHRLPILALEGTAFTQNLELVHQVIKLVNGEDRKCGLPGVIFPKSDLERQDVSPHLGYDRIEIPQKSSKT